jgi:hypothetical protein
MVGNALWDACKLFLQVLHPVETAFYLGLRIIHGFGMYPCNILEALLKRGPVCRQSLTVPGL